MFSRGGTLLPSMYADACTTLMPPLFQRPATMPFSMDPFGVHFREWEMGCKYNAMCCVQCAGCRVQCAVCSVQCTQPKRVHAAHCTLHAARCTLHAVCR